MNKTIIIELNNILKKSEIDRKDESLIGFIRYIILNKHNISYDEYYAVLKDHGIRANEKEIGYNEICIEHLENISQEISAYDFCKIFDEYLNSDIREVSGSYYTPTYIVEYIFYNSLKSYFEENTNLELTQIDSFIKDQRTDELNREEAELVFNLLDNIKIIDISCGTGLFLLKALNKIITLKEAILRKLDIIVENYNLRRSVIEENIYGIDIDGKPLEVLLLALIDDLAKFKEFNIKNLLVNIYKENSISDNKIYNLSGIKEVMECGGFDLVIGNPPYIGEKGNREKFENIKKSKFGRKYYEGKMDYFYFFIYRGTEILKEKGILTYITTNYFITADGASKLRKFLKDNVVFKSIINFNECHIFRSAKGQHNLIFSVSKEKKINKNIEVIYFNSSLSNDKEIENILKNPEKKYRQVSHYKLENQHSMYGLSGNILIYTDSSYAKIIDKIKENSNYTLGDICNINQGIVSGADRVTKNMLNKKLSKDLIEKNNIVLNKGIFVLNKEEIKNNGFCRCPNLKPFYKNSDVKKYYTKQETDKYIFYSNDNNVFSSKYCKLVSNHLIKFKSILKQRRETAKGVRKWYALQWSRNQEIFENPKIVVPQRSVKNNFGYNELSWYASADVYYITPKEDIYDLKLLLGILNSKLIYFWLYNLGKRKGNYLELYSRPLSEIPIKLNINEDIKNSIVDKVEKILDACSNGYDKNIVDGYQDIIDNELYKIYSLTKKDIEIIDNLFYLVKSNR